MAKPTKITCKTNKTCKKLSKSMLCSGKNNQKRCVCKNKCQNFAESSVCAYSIDDEDQYLMTFGNICEVAYFECLMNTEGSIVSSVV